MTKIENYVFTHEEIRQGNRKTLLVMINYLCSKNIKIKCYFEANSASVILKYKGLEISFKNSSKACEYLYKVYVNLQEQEKQNLIKSLILREHLEQIGG